MEAISRRLSASNSDVSESERREVVLGGERCSVEDGIIDVSVSMNKLDFRYAKTYTYNQLRYKGFTLLLDKKSTFTLLQKTNLFISLCLL